MFNDTIRPPPPAHFGGPAQARARNAHFPRKPDLADLVAEGENIYEEIPSLPGQYHYSPDELGRMVERAHEHGVSRVILFGLPRDKDEIGSGAWAEDGIVTRDLV